MDILRSTATRMKIFSFRFAVYVCLWSFCLSLCWSVIDCSSTLGPRSAAVTSTKSPAVVTTNMTAPGPRSAAVTSTKSPAVVTTNMTAPGPRSAAVTSTKSPAVVTTNMTAPGPKSTAVTSTTLTAVVTTNMTAPGPKSTAVTSTTSTAVVTTNMIAPKSTAVTSTTVTINTTTPIPPPDVTNVTVIGQTEKSVTIQFDKAVNITDYRWYYSTNGINKVENFQGDDDNQVTYTLYNLTAAQTYNMSLHSVLDGRESNGFLFNASTAPENVATFEIKDQNESSITLVWTVQPNISLYILKFEGKEDRVTAEESTGYVVSNLNSSTLYEFTLFSVFEGIRSTGANRTAATAPPNAEGFRSDFTSMAKCHNGSRSGCISSNGSGSSYGSSSSSGKRKSSNLSSSSSNSSITNTTRFISGSSTPRNARCFKVFNQTATSITLQWEPVTDVVDYKLEINKNRTENVTGNHTTVSGLQSATFNNFTLFAVFESIPSTGTPLTAPTAPRDADGFKTQSQTETNITLEWKKVDNIPDYVLVINGTNVSVLASSESLVTYQVSNLQSGTLYNLTLYTQFANLSSLGAKIEACTVPLAVASVKVTNRTLNMITLQWESLRQGWIYLLEFGSIRTVLPNEGLISHSVGSLKPGTVYPFNITTQFCNLTSQKYEAYTATAIDCEKVDWHVNESSIEGVVEGAFTNATASNDTQKLINSGSRTTNTVSFTDLYPGANYTIMLKYEELEQCHHKLTTIPPQLDAKCKNWDAGYSVYIEWDKPYGVWDSVEVNISKEMHIVAQNGEQYAEIPNFQPAQKYEVSISSRSGRQKSIPNVFICPTDPRGVIAGAFFGVLLFVILVCGVVYVMRKRPDITSSQKKSLIGSSKSIPVAKFPSHFNELSADENRGFSAEYEDLAPVGTEQTQKAAIIQENKPKNRFVNVLPYDRSRVKLTSSASHDDYINANYMPGYNSDREYIAAQGPMPSTVNDFWRMIWEQKVRGIVMVTNCTEGGRTKCEQYWPAESSPRVCGDLAVFTTSEEKESSWTLREFKIKHRCTAEERTVKHFHFTAWPDHGVPLGTSVLIQFRTLVRRHIQTEAAGTPTVVHCSAGVGRTGTIIALDVLLQQLQKEQAVDINGFVHRMRLNRPHMVQTESQYVFLHQCIMDSLQPNETCEENIYENEVIYANATALREFQNNMYKA